MVIRNIRVSFYLFLFLMTPTSLLAMQGFYLGGSIGGRFTEATQRQASKGIFDGDVESLKYQSNIFDEDFSQMIFAGYGLSWCDFYLAAEAIVQLGSFHLKDSQFFITDWPSAIGSALHIRVPNYQFCLDFLPGFYLGPMTLLYARLGASFAKTSVEVEADLVDLAAFFDSATLKQKNENSWPHLRLGAGVEQFIASHVSLRLDYVYTDYGSTFFQPTQLDVRLNFASMNSHIHLYDHRTMLGLAYHFACCQEPCIFDAPCSASGYRGLYVGSGIGGSILKARQEGSLLGTSNDVFNFADHIEAGVPSRVYHNQFQSMFFVGFGIPWSRLYLGGEAFASLSTHADIDFKLQGSFNRFGSKISSITAETLLTLSSWQYGLVFRPGILLTPYTLVNARVGASVALIKANANAFNADQFLTDISLFLPQSTFVSKRKAVLQIGLGIEHQLSRKVHLRADYFYSDYGFLSFNTTVTGSDSDLSGTVGSLTTSLRTRLCTHALTLGLSYYFGRN